MKFRNTQSGFSLVEGIMYMALFAALSTMLINSLVITMRSYNENRVNNDLLDSAHVVMERVTREIRTADSIDGSNSTFTTSPGALQLNTTDSVGTAKTVKFDVSSNKVRFTDNGTVAGDLIGSKVDVTSLIFRNITTTAGEAVRIEMTLQSQRPPSNKSMTFYNTIALRGSY